ncbi:hypothetical protein F5141DRAFT_1067588 [Pisolithus sp. B1]|nr:hypothetical protein F5141DRAFT_1067588 [Pisolithus sp. B1]
MQVVLHIHISTNNKSKMGNTRTQDACSMVNKGTLTIHMAQDMTHDEFMSALIPSDVTLIAEPQVKGSRHPGGEGSYHYREQSGSGSGHGKESGSGECEPAPIPAGVTYPVPPVHPLMSSRRYGNVGVEQERQREREGNEHREGKGGDARDEY